MSLRNDTRSARATKACEATTDAGTPPAKSRTSMSREASRPARADEKRAFLHRLERSRTSLFHGSD